MVCRQWVETAKINVVNEIHEGQIAERKRSVYFDFRCQKFQQILVNTVIRLYFLNLKTYFFTRRNKQEIVAMDFFKGRKLDTEIGKR